MQCLDLPYPLSTNNIFTTHRDGKRYKSKASVAYHEEAGWIARQAFAEPLRGRVQVQIRYWPKRGVGLDVDNVAKCALDALKGICWIDDSQIWELSIERVCVRPGGFFQVWIGEIEETK